MRLFRYTFSKFSFSFLLPVLLGLGAMDSLISQQDSCAIFDIKTRSGQKGDTLCLDVVVKNFKDITGFQFTISYDPTVVTPISIPRIANLTNFTQGDVIINRNRDVISALWTDPNSIGESLPDGEVLFTICFLVIGNPGDCSPVKFSNIPTTIEVLRKYGSLDSVICFIDPDPDDQIKVLAPPGLTVVSSACGTLTNTGTITIKSWGGSAPYTVTSNAPNGNGTIPKAGDCLIISNLSSGNYNFTVTDSTGKDTMFVVQVLNAPPMAINNDISYTRDPTCYNRPDGRIGITFTGGVGKPKIIWSPLGTFGNTRETRLFAGKYKITLIDSFGCVAEREIVLTADTLKSSITIDKTASCFGKCDGQVTVTATGGTPFLGGYNFYWSQAVSRNCAAARSCTNDSLCGDQFVIIADRNRLTGGEACRDTIFFNVPYSGDLRDSVLVDSVRCFGEANGRIRAFVSSAGTLQLPLSFVLRTAAGNQVPGGTVNINEYTSPGLAAGIYYLSITDSLGCSLEDTIEVFQPFLLELVTLQLDSTESCAPGADAFIEVRGLGGTQAYNYQWDYQSSTSPRISGLTAGSYNITLTDAKGCTVSKSFTVTRPTGPVITGFNAVDVNCPGDSSGCIEVLVTAGSDPNLNFSWSVPGSTSRLCNLPSGLYSVTVTDGNGCSATAMDSIRFSGNAIRIDSFVIVQPSCPGKADGLIIVFARGGSGLLTYSWDNGVNSQVNASLRAGRYIVSVDDVGGCPAVQDTFTLIDPPKPLVNVSGFTAPSCATSSVCDGSADVTVNTADTLVTITWSSGEQRIFNSNAGIFNFRATALCEGPQFVIVTVNALCSDTIFFNIPAPVPIRLDSSRLILQTPSCFGRTDGSITVNAKGGRAPYSYQWINGPQGPTISNIGDGYYYVRITDSLGCVHTDSVRLRQPDTIRVQIIQGSSLDVSCPGANDGRITLVWSGGNGSRGTFNWSPNVGVDSVLTQLSAGTYQVTITDGNGCTGTAVHTIREPQPMQLTLTPITPPTCDDGQVNFSVLNVTGGNGPVYRFTIQGGAPNQIGDRVPLFSGSYAISVFDVNGCRKDTTIVIPPALNSLSVDFGSDQETIQLGDSILLSGNVKSIVRIDSVIWTPSRFVSSPDSTDSYVTPTSNTTFTLTVVDENGCRDFDVITILVEELRRVFIPNAMSPNNDGINDFLEITVGPDVAEIEFVEVYDRWGGRVYKLDRPDLGSGTVRTWDGSFRGDPVNPGVYVFQASVVFRDGYRLVYRGDITVIR